MVCGYVGFVFAMGLQSSLRWGRCIRVVFGYCWLYGSLLRSLLIVIAIFCCLTVGGVI